jgi:hypothetical protein
LAQLQKDRGSGFHSNNGPQREDSVKDGFANPSYQANAFRDNQKIDAPAADSPYMDAGLDQLEAYANDPSNQVNNNPDPREPSTGMQQPDADTGANEAFANKNNLRNANPSNKNDAPPTNKVKSQGADKDKAKDVAKGNSKSGSGASGGGNLSGGRSGAGLSGGSDDKAGAANAQTVVNALAGGRKKTNGVKLAIAGSIVLLGFTAFFLTLPLKLIHFASVLFNHNMAAENHTEGKAERKFMHRLFVLQQDDTSGHKSTAKNWITRKMTNMQMDKFNKIMSAKQLQFEFDGKNRLIGVKDLNTGELVTKDFRNMSYWEQRGTLGQFVTETLGPHRYLQHALYPKAMRVHAGVSFKFWTTDRVKDLKDKLVSKVREGLSGDKALEEPKLPDKNGQSSDATKAQDAAAAAQVAESGEIGKAEWDTFQKTKSMIQAHQAAFKAFYAKVALANGFSGMGMIYCMIHQMIADAQRLGALQIMYMLMREGNVPQTQKDQLQAGENLNFDEMGEMASRLDGDPNQDPAKSVDGKGFTESCAWKTATTTQACSTYLDKSTLAGMDHYNPGLDPSANPDSDQFLGWVANVAGLFNLPLTDQVCAVLNSWFGWVIMGVELVAAAFSGEFTTALAGALKGLLVGAVIHELLGRLIDAATGLAVTGLENATGYTNNAHAGMFLSSSNWSRVMGGRVGTKKEKAKIADAAHQDELEYASRAGWTYRTFAIENTHSLVGQVVDNTPSSAAGMVAAIRNTLIAAPSNFAALFFRPKLAYAATDTDSANLYGFREYVTTDEEIDRYEPDQVLDYLSQPIPGTTKTRLSMLGDVETYTPADHSFGPQDGGDTDTTNLRHCFLGNLRVKGDTPDPICLDLGVLTGDGIDNPKNPDRHEIMDLIYCQANNVCEKDYPSLTYNDDFTQYRLYIKYAFLTRALGGLEDDDKDPFAGTGATIADAYGICQVPAVGADPGAKVPPDNYNRITYQGVTLNQRTMVMLQNAEHYANNLGYKGAFILTQGSYDTSTTASAGTHDGGGAMDIGVGGMSAEQRTIVVKALRMAGFAAWNRYPPAFPNHIHAIAIGDKEMSSGAADQVVDYFNHKDGLAGHGPDGDAAAGYPYPDWAGELCSQTVANAQPTDPGSGVVPGL